MHQYNRSLAELINKNQAEIKTVKDQQRLDKLQTEECARRLLSMISDLGSADDTQLVPQQDGVQIVTGDNRCPICLDDIEFGEECAIICAREDHKLHKLCYTAMKCAAGTGTGDGSHVLPHEVRCPLCRGRREDDPLSPLWTAAAPSSSATVRAASSTMMSEETVREMMLECGCLANRLEQAIEIYGNQSGEYEQETLLKMLAWALDFHD